MTTTPPYVCEPCDNEARRGCGEVCYTVRGIAKTAAPCECHHDGTAGDECYVPR